jgi:hypothetical protein
MKFHHITLQFLHNASMAFALIRLLVIECDCFNTLAYKLSPYTSVFFFNNLWTNIHRIWKYPKKLALKNTYW